MATPSHDAWSQWRGGRIRALTSVPGNLALVSYQPVGHTPAPIDVVPGATVRRAGDLEGVVICAQASQELLVDGAVIDGDTFVSRLRPDGTPIIQWRRYRLDVFTLDGTDYELRVYDVQAENLANFDGIETYDFDESLVVKGTFASYDATDHVPWDFTRAADAGHTKRVPGTITVQLYGKTHELVAFLDGSELVLVFADATTGVESYAPGRFLRIHCPQTNGEVSIDFNQSFVPPCGFSDFYSCPIPPIQNKLSVPVRAGEKRVRWKTPRH